MPTNLWLEINELTLKLRTTEVLDDILPVRGVVETAQVRLELAAKNLQRGTLANTVGSDKTEHLVRARHGQAVKLEAVGAITVGDLALEVGGQVDDGDGVERALLGADTTTNAEGLGDEGEAGIGSNFNAELATANDGARLFAFLSALPGATLFGRARWSVWRGSRQGRAGSISGGAYFVAVDDGDTGREKLASCKLHRTSR